MPSARRSRASPSESGLRAPCQTWTSNPRAASRRPATTPSRPLLPEPASTSTLGAHPAGSFRSASSASTTSATPSPARSWSTRSWVPAATAAASRARISATETTAYGSGTLRSWPRLRATDDGVVGRQVGHYRAIGVGARVRPREGVAGPPGLERWLVLPARHDEVLAALLGPQQVERDEASHVGHAARIALERLLQALAVLRRRLQSVDRHKHRFISFWL